MKCENCVHREVCKNYQDAICLSQINGLTVTVCPFYKDKDLIVELPCKIGDTVYVITEYTVGKKEIVKCRVNKMRLKSNGVTLNFSCMGRYSNDNCYNGNFTFKSIGKTVFLTKSEAEKALEGMKK